MIRKFATTVCFALCLQAGQTLANEPVAIIEEIEAPSLDLQIMDFVELDQVIDLGADGRLVLGYLLSCVRETVVGGKVTVGEEESSVDGGTVETEEVDCDGGSSVTVSSAGARAGGAVFRNTGQQGRLPKPGWTTFGLSPAFRISGGVETVTIDRMDKQEPTLSVPVRGGMADLAATGKSLSRGGLYQVASGPSRALVLKVSPLAEAKAPLLSRFVPF